jgi:hypothetical protein
MFRAYVKQVIYRYLDCGILYNGFACVKCKAVAMSIFWPSHANAGTFVLPVIRKFGPSSSLDTPLVAVILVTGPLLVRTILLGFTVITTPTI